MQIFDQSVVPLFHTSPYTHIQFDFAHLKNVNIKFIIIVILECVTYVITTCIVYMNFGQTPLSPSHHCFPFFILVLSV